MNTLITTLRVADMTARLGYYSYLIATMLLNCTICCDNNTDVKETGITVSLIQIIPS